MTSTFPLTPWSSILRGEELDDDARREMLRGLLGRYWKPLYSCVRFGWRLEPEAARRRLEEFFYALLHTDMLRGLDPEKGRFREFLKRRLNEFMAAAGEEPAAAGEAPREAGVADLGDSESLEMPPGDPESVFDDSWVTLLIERALARYAEEFRDEADGGSFAVFEKVDLAPEPRSKAQIAAELGIDEARLADRLHEARKHFRRVMAEQIHDYALDDSDARRELKWTIG